MAMIDLYEIGVEFMMQGDLEGQVSAASEQFAMLEEAIGKVNEALAETAMGADALRGDAMGLAEAWGEAASAAERMAAAVRASSVGAGEATRPGEVPPYEPPIEPRESGPVPTPTFDPVADGDGGGRGGGEPPTIMPPADDEGGGNGKGKGGKGHANPWEQIIVGTAVAHGAKSALTAVYDQAADIQHQETLMKIMGGASDADLKQAQQEALSLQQKYPGLSQADAMVILRDAFMNTRNMKESITVSDELARSAYVLQEEGKSDAAEEMFSALRAGEMRGLLSKRNPDGSIDMSGFLDFVNDFTRASESTGGRLTPQMALNIMKNAGPEGILMSQDAVTDAMILSTDMGAPQVGTGINALATEFLGGKMSQGAAQNLHKIGLLPDSMFGKNGKILDEYKNGIGQVLIPNGDLKGEDQFKDNPFAWVENTFLPAVEKASGPEQSALLNALYADMSRIPGARLAAETIFQNGYLEKELANLQQTASVGGAAADATKDPKNVAGGVVTAFDSFLAAVGSGAMPVATTQLTALTKALDGLTDWAEHHPNADKVLFGGGEALAVGMTTAAAVGAARVGSSFIRSFLPGGARAAAGAVAEGAADATAAGGSLLAGAASSPAGIVALMTAVAVAAAKKLSDEYAKAGLDPTMMTGEYIPGKPMQVQIVPSSNPMPVHVTNAGDVASGAVSSLANHQGKMPVGPNGVNNSLSAPHPGSDIPGVSMP